MHELELSDIAALGRLIEICSERLKDQPEVLARVTAWLTNSVEQGARNIRLDTEAFYHAMSGEREGEDIEELDRVPIDRLVGALDVLVSEKRAEVKPPRWIVSTRNGFQKARLTLYRPFHTPGTHPARS